MQSISILRMQPMPRLRSVSLGWIAWVCSACAASQVSAQKTLEWKFVEGRKIQVTMFQDLDMNFRNEDARTTQVTELLWTIKNVESDNSADVEQEIVRVRADFHSPRINFSVDSEKEEAREGAAAVFANGVLPLIGAKFTARTEPSGKVRSTRIPKEVTDRLNKQVPLGEGALRDITSKSALQFPIKKLAVGESWNSEVVLDMQGLGKMTVLTTYNYVGEETLGNRTLDKFKSTSAVKISNPDPKSQLALTKQSGDGYVWFDNDLGMIDHIEASQDMEFQFKDGNELRKQAIKTELRMEFSIAKE